MKSNARSSSSGSGGGPMAVRLGTTRPYRPPYPLPRLTNATRPWPVSSVTAPGGGRHLDGQRVQGHQPSGQDRDRRRRRAGDRRGATSFYLIQQAQQHAGQGEAQLVKVVVAAQIIPARTPIQPGALVLREIPLDPDDAGRHPHRHGAAHGQGAGHPRRDRPADLREHDCLSRRSVRLLDPRAGRDGRAQFRGVARDLDHDPRRSRGRGPARRRPDHRHLHDRHHDDPRDRPAGRVYYSDMVTKITYQDMVILARSGTQYILKTSLAVAEEINHLLAAGTVRSAPPSDRTGRPLRRREQARRDHEPHPAEVRPALPGHLPGPLGHDPAAAPAPIPHPAADGPAAHPRSLPRRLLARAAPRPQSRVAPSGRGRMTAERQADEVLVRPPPPGGIPPSICSRDGQRNAICPDGHPADLKKGSGLPFSLQPRSDCSASGQSDGVGALLGGADGQGGRT